jgi:tetratricopeptide (TPR) repeat protein
MRKGLAHAVRLFAQSAMVCLIFLQVFSAAAEEPLPLWKKMFTTGQRFDFDLRAIQDEAIRAKASALVAMDCDSILYAQYVHAVLHTYSGQDWDVDADLATFQCVWRGSPIFQMAAIRAYNSGQYEEAVRYYRGALNEAKNEDMVQQRYALEGLAVALVAQSRYTEAMGYFEQVYALDSIHLDPSHLNNMSFAAFASGACDDAYRYAELSLVRLKDLHDASPNSFRFQSGLQNVALLNQLQASMAMGRADLAGKAFGGIQFADDFAGREAAAVRLATLYCQEENSVEQFAFIRGQLMELLKLDSFARVDIGANDWLFNEGDWRAHWEDLRRIPVALRGGVFGHCGPANPAALPGGVIVRHASHSCKGKGFLWSLRQILRQEFS